MFSSFEFSLLVIILGAAIFIIVLSIHLYLKYKEIKRIKAKPEAITDFKYIQESLDFLDRLIKNKYNFHMYTTLIPIYLDNKIPEKKMVHELKEKIYVSVVGGLSIKTKKSILDFFTEKGVEIYIHEKIMIMMNETDFKTAGKYSEGFRDLKPNQMQNIMP